MRYFDISSSYYINIPTATVNPDDSNEGIIFIYITITTTISNKAQRITWCNGCDLIFAHFLEPRRLSPITLRRVTTSRAVHSVCGVSKWLVCVR